MLALRSDAYALREDYGVQLAPEREEPRSSTSTRTSTRLVGDFEPRFPAGPPSLVACERLVVSGDVTFGRDVVVRGMVNVQGPARIGDGMILTDWRWCNVRTIVETEPITPPSPAVGMARGRFPWRATNPRGCCATWPADHQSTTSDCASNSGSA